MRFLFPFMVNMLFPLMLQCLELISVKKSQQREIWCHHMNFLTPSPTLQNTPTASLQRGKNPLLNKCPGYDTKQSDGDVPVMLELWGMQSTTSLPSLPSPLGSGVVVPNRFLSMGQIELNYVLILNWIAWSRIVTFKLCTNAKLNCLK